MSENNQERNPQIDILDMSSVLQSEIIRELSAESELASMMTRIVERAAMLLHASACTVFTKLRDEPRAVQLAATGYQRQFDGKRYANVLPSTQVPEVPKPGEELGLTSWILSTGKPFLARSPQEVVGHPHHSGRWDVQQTPGQPLQLQGFLGVPLRGIRGEIVGMIKAERRMPEPHDEKSGQPEPFNERDQLVLETVARVASRCITYLEMARNKQESEAVTAWAREVIAEAVVTEGELDSFLDIVARVVRAALRSDSCGIFLTDEGGKTLTQRAGNGSQALQRVIRAYQMPEPEVVRQCKESPTCHPGECENRKNGSSDGNRRRVGLTPWIAATGKSFYASNFEELSAHCHHQGAFDRWNFPKEKRQLCGAFLGVPLQVGGAIIGVVKVENISPIGECDTRDFGNDGQQRLEILAQDIALSVMRLRDHIPARYRVIRDAQKTILEILRGGLDIPELAQKVVTETRKLFNAGACVLFLREGNRLIQPPWAASGWGESGPRVRAYDLVEPTAIKDDPSPSEKVGLTVWIAVKQAKFTARSNLELKMHPHHKGTFDQYNFQEGNQCESLMGFPLLINEDNETKLVGVLKVETKQRGTNDEEKEVTYFNELDEIVFELIANSTAIAIQNARLSESAHLADQVINQPDNDGIIRVLHSFAQGRENVVATLDHTARIVGTENPQRGEIVLSFARLLEPNFHDAVLAQLAGQVGSPLRNLLLFLGSAYRVDSVVKISDLARQLQSPDLLPAAALTGPGSFLKASTEMLIATTEAVGEGLEEYMRNDTQRSMLKECMTRLENEQKKLEDTDLFERNLVGRAFARWHQILTAEYERFRLIRNPFIVGPPLRTADVFRGREDIFQFIADNLQGPVQGRTLVLQGQRRTGKTSILYQLQGGRLGNNLIPVLIDLQGMSLVSSTDEFLEVVGTRIARAAQEAGLAVEDFAIANRDKSATYAVDRLLDDLEAKLADRHMLVMIDEFEVLDEWIASGKVDVNVLSYLRSLIQHRGRLLFIFTGSRQLEQMRQDHWSVLFNIAIYRRVSFLDSADATRLIHDPIAEMLDVDQAATEEIIRLTRAHPYFVQLVCWGLVNHCNTHRRNTATRQDVEAVVDKVLESGIAYFAFIWQNAEQNERLALSALAQCSGSAEDWVRPDDLASLLAGYPGVRTKSSEIRQSLDKLASREVLEKSQEETVQYRFQVELLRTWVRKQQPLVTVVESEE